MLTRRTVVWQTRETTYGTDPAMTSADGIEIYDVNIDLKGEKLERPALRDSISNIQHVIGMKECELTFKTSLKGMGAVTSVGSLEVADLLSGCSFNTGVYSGTTTVFSLVSAENQMNSVAFRVFLDDANSHKITGARGTVKFNLNAGKYGEAEWKFNGLYNSVTAATTPSVVLSSVVPPVIYNAGFQIGGFSPVSSSAEIDLGIDVVRRESLNATQGVHSFRVTGRKPMLKCDLDAIAESSYPVWANWEANVVATFALTAGSSPTNIIKFGGYFQSVQPKYGDSDGVRTYDLEAALVSSIPSSSNDEFSITFI